MIHINQHDLNLVNRRCMQEFHNIMNQSLNFDWKMYVYVVCHTPWTWLPSMKKTYGK